MALEGVFAVLPLLMMILIGYTIAKTPWFGRTGMNFLSKFITGIVLPLYMISNVTRIYTKPEELSELAANLPYPLILVFAAIVISSIMSVPLGIRPPQCGVFINGVSLSNTVVMGLPVTLALFGDSVLPVVMIYYASNTLTYWTVGIWLLRREAPERVAKGVLASLQEALRTPPLFGFLLGILWVLLGIPMPEFVARMTASVGNSVTALSMVFIGSVIRFADFRNMWKKRDIFLILPYKYIVTPVISGLILMHLPVPALMKQVFFILSNMPSMAQLPIMAKELGSDYELASLTTAVTTSISMASVPVYIFLMEYSGIFA